MFEAAIYAKLATLVDKVYPVVAPLDAPASCIVYNCFSTDPTNDLDGLPAQTWAKMQIDVYDPDHATAIAVAKSVRQLLLAWDDADVSGASFLDERGLPAIGSQIVRYRICQDWLLFGPMD